MHPPSERGAVGLASVVRGTRSLDVRLCLRPGADGATTRIFARPVLSENSDRDGMRASAHSLDTDYASAS
jgi:hypothetical protein